MSASKGGIGSGGGGGTNVQSFRGRGGAFGMLLHKVQTAPASAMPVTPGGSRPGAMSAGLAGSVDGEGGGVSP